MRSKVPTSNFFTQLGYEHNPVARKNNTAAALLSATDAVMDREQQLPGAKDLAASF
jgi:predicted lactoylglutathione lyase